MTVSANTNHALALVLCRMELRDREGRRQEKGKLRTINSRREFDLIALARRGPRVKERAEVSVYRREGDGS